MNEPVPIILGGHVNGLGLVRSFGNAGIHCICLDRYKSLAFQSKYASSYLCPDPEVDEEEFIQYLIELGRSLPRKGMLFATNDSWLVPISKNQDRLSQFFIYPMSRWDVINRCWNKRKLYEVAQVAGIPIAKTHFVKDSQDFEAILDKVDFPCVIKPEITIGFMERIGSKGRTIAVSNVEELRYWLDRYVKTGLDGTPLIIQDLITGPVTNLYTITSYSDSNGNIIAYSIGHKLRQNPPDAGTIISGKVENRPEILDLGSRLIKTLEFHGIANTEFKKDDKDGSYKLIEINPRPGMWNYSAFMSGVNIPYISYQDNLGRSYDRPSEMKDGLIWLMLLEDFIYSVIINKISGYEEYAVSISDWIKTIRGKRIYAIESVDDPLPGVMHAATFFIDLLRHLRVRKISTR